MRASSVPEVSAEPAPHSTNPAAKLHVVGTTTQPVKATPASSVPRASIRGRDHASATAPEGTSRTRVVSDQRKNSAEIPASDIPCSANNRG